MSNIYIQEPPASGKVLLKTTAGDIDIELWTKEAPKACKNFIQLCLEDYYNGTIFHRVVPDFIVQGGDPNGDGTGGKSIYGEPFKDEFHSRLRFNRRGLVACANAGKDDNGSQFFFTLGATPELQNKHTIFGKVTGETIFNVLKLAEGERDEDDRPLYPKKIVSVEVLINPFTDIEPRKTKKETKQENKTETKKPAGVKNLVLLSFGEEAEEDEEEVTVFRNKPKSTHDLLDDPKLSKLSATDVEPANDDLAKTKEETEATQATLSSIRDKLKGKKPSEPQREKVVEPEAESDGSEEEYYLGKDRVEARKKQMLEIRGQIRDLKREMAGKKKKDQDIKEDKPSNIKEDKTENNEMMKNFEEEQEKYRKKNENLPKKGTSREEFTLSLLKKFKNKLSSIKEKTHESKEEKAENSSSGEKGDQAEDDDDNEDWLAHELRFEDKGAVLAKDASTKGDDWFDIYDPRNPLNKRKREMSKNILQNKSRKKE